MITGPHTLCTYPNCIVIGSVGKTLPGVKTLIDQPDAEGNGEVRPTGDTIIVNISAS